MLKLNQEPIYAYTSTSDASWLSDKISIQSARFPGGFMLADIALHYCEAGACCMFCTRHAKAFSMPSVGCWIAWESTAKFLAACACQSAESCTTYLRVTFDLTLVYLILTLICTCTPNTSRLPAMLCRSSGCMPTTCAWCTKLYTLVQCLQCINSPSVNVPDVHATVAVGVMAQRTHYKQNALHMMKLSVHTTFEQHKTYGLVWSSWQGWTGRETLWCHIDMRSCKEVLANTSTVGPHICTTNNCK